MLNEVALKILQAFWFIAPAYAANAFPPLLKGKHPLDFGKNLGKYRILGDGKTIEGSIGGIVFGMFIGLIEIYCIYPFVPTEFSLPKLSLIIVFLLSTGAILGDIFVSFIKRRFGIKRGASLPILDQLDFLLGALVLSSLVVRHDIAIVFILIIFTPLIHILANTLGYILRIKRVPY
jgi:CDP-2,3-bis-(O-geranylgeranyl)-sn-glycerol synthase